MVLSGSKKHLNPSKDNMENYNENSDVGYFIEVDVQYPKKLHGLHDDLSILPKWMKIEKVSFNDEKEYIIHKGNSNEALNYGLVLHRKCIESKSCPKSYNDMNTELRKNAK